MKLKCDFFQHTRGRFDPDTTRMSFLTGNHPSQLDLNSNRSGTPPMYFSLWKWLRPVISSADCHPSNNLEPGRTSSSNQSLKRDFSTAFEGLHPSFRQSVEREVNLFPNIPKDARHRFLMKQSAEDFKFHCRTVMLMSKLFQMLLFLSASVFKSSCVFVAGCSQSGVGL